LVLVIPLVVIGMRRLLATVAARSSPQILPAIFSSSPATQIHRGRPARVQLELYAGIALPGRLFDTDFVTRPNAFHWFSSLYGILRSQLCPGCTGRSWPAPMGVASAALGGLTLLSLYEAGEMLSG
jgi:hypothetical protein